MESPVATLVRAAPAFALALAVGLLSAGALNLQVRLL